MTGRVVFRLDDICPDMNYEKFARAKNLFLQYGVSPLIGIIPENKDVSLKSARDNSEFVSDEQIWNELLALHRDQGWCVALHGFDHQYISREPGILNLNHKSEFAGIHPDVQRQKISDGLRILEARGFFPTAFMAPSHSFDSNTLEILREHLICVITDGEGIFPYVLQDTLFMPVPRAPFWHFPVGVYTICLHTNTMREKDFARLSNFLKRHSQSCLSFLDAVDLAEQYKAKRWPNWLNRVALLYMHGVLGLISRIKKTARET